MNKPPYKHQARVDEDPWAGLRAFTNARIALGHVGGSLPLREVLAFRLAHANAKDAIGASLGSQALAAGCQEMGLPFYTVQSQAAHRAQYLQRPDLGRLLAPKSVAVLEGAHAPCDIVAIIADGLSAEAANQHALPTLRLAMGYLKPYRVVCVAATQARVALADPIGALLGAKLTAIMIGERPGLSSPVSMGIYTTYAPQPGTTDERRNCISNIHQDGLSHQEAARLLGFLATESLQKKLSGVSLKVDLGRLPPPDGPGNSLA